MRVAVLSDIHSNLTALHACLDDLHQQGKPDEVWCPGDLVGYGPDPHECIAVLRDICTACVAGNHDWAAVGKIDTYNFNYDAAEAAEWTSAHLAADDRAFLSNLPEVIERGEFTITHGSPRAPLYEYILTPDAAMTNMYYFRTQHCIVGHSHVPVAFISPREGQIKEQPLGHGTEMALGAGRLIINPGGVGQPRDGDPRASYGLIDTGRRTFTLRRVPYDIASVQSRIRAAGLPEMLASRLGFGT
jgi:diadenosine tetraphosphatase ApaH/serine/threonine PP2A family protein phosphatase